ncbi:MAG: hypothetical protein H7335_20270 [Massilia sp.]|nr:hypothetical protein [Massilia sp.]
MLPMPKNGWVVGFYNPQTPRSELPNCLAALPAEALSTHRYAKIDYRHVRRMLVEVADVQEIAGDTPVAIGDRVQLLPQDCDAGRLSRITSILPAKAQYVLP